MGLAMGIILRWKDTTMATVRNTLYRANRISVTFSLLGCAILLITLPFLVVSHHKNFYVDDFLFYTPVLCLIFSSSSGLLGSISISLVTGRKPNVRNFIHGPVAGIIIGGASSYFTANLAYCIGVGLVGGTLQGAIQHIIEYRIVRRHRIFTTISFTLFGLQGLLGCITAAIGKAIIDVNASGLDYKS